MSQFPKLPLPWRRLSDEEVREMIERLDREPPLVDYTRRGILPCLCGGTGYINAIGGPRMPCPYCSPKIGGSYE